MASNYLASDTAMLQHLNKGKEFAFDYIFHRYFPLMVVYAQRFTNNLELAEELVQDAFFKVWQKHSDFNDVQSLKGFLYVSIKNAAFNALDKVNTRRKHYNSFALGMDDTDEPVIREIIRSEVYSSLSKAIQSLPEQCRKIIQMLFEEDMTPSEIAKKLDISVSTVNSQKARGLMLLKQRVSPKDLDFLLLLISISFLRR